MIPLSVPSISGNEWEYIKECLDTGWVSSVGGYVNAFEESLSEYVGSKFAVAVINGTSALHVSLLACGVQPKDEVIVPTLTFIAPVNAVRYCGAFPVFMDSDNDTLCMDVEKLCDFITTECMLSEDGYTYNRKTGRRIKAIIPVHVFGHPVDMDSLIDLCRKNNIDIIEDATESLGSEYKGKKTGVLGKLGCFSFNGNKIITTGGGGMVVTDDGALATKIRHLTTQAKSDSIEYDHDEIGYNYRLTNIQAAMGVAQMEKLESFIEKKIANAKLYRDLLLDLEGLMFLTAKEWAKSNYWYYTLKVHGNQKNSLMKYLLSKKIQVRPLWKLIHTLPMYQDCQTFTIDKALEDYDTCLNLPCSVNIKKEEIEYVVENIRQYFQ